MRTDKFLTESGFLTRKEAVKAVRCGRVTVNGATATDPARHIDPQADTVCLDGAPVRYAPFVYYMLNKPTGYVSATEDGQLPTVVSLLPPEIQKRCPFPCGRLDRDTVGLMLLTDDGALAHRLLAPKNHVPKTYRFACAEPLCPEAEARCAAGMTLADGEQLKPALLCPTPDRMGGEITLSEGKYHQIKRMAGALSNRITALERITFGPLTIDPALRRGECRPLTDDEIDCLRRAAETAGTVQGDRTAHPAN